MTDSGEAERAIRQEYRKTRYAYIIGSERPNKEYSRSILGYDKARRFVRLAGNLRNKKVANIFSGPGGILKLLSLELPALLVGFDKRYPATEQKQQDGVVFDAKRMLSEWSEFTKRLKVPSTSMDQIFFKWGDAHTYSREMLCEIKFDAIFIDPPFGRASVYNFQIDETEAILVLASAIKLSLENISEQGKIVCIAPAPLIERALKCVDLSAYDLVERSMGGDSGVIAMLIERS